VPVVLVVLPEPLPVTYTVWPTLNIEEEVTVKSTVAALDGLPLVVALVCLSASYCACDPLQKSSRLFFLFPVAPDSKG